MKSASEIGEIIRRLRGNDSLRDFAQKCHVSHTTIDNLEKGIDHRTGKPVEPKMATLEKISQACGVSLSIFTSESDVEIIREDDLQFLQIIGDVKPLDDDVPVEINAVNVLLASAGKNIWKIDGVYRMDDVDLTEDEINDLLNMIVLSVKNAADALYAKKKRDVRDFFVNKQDV